MKFFCPQGIGDSLWALHKIRSIANGEPIDLLLSSSGENEVQRRALPFLERFGFLSSVGLARRNCIRDESKPTTPKGYWNYLPDGMAGDTFNLMPNAALERGIRLEDWLPEYPIDWQTIDAFRIDEVERIRAKTLLANLGPYAVFYLGPLDGNTKEGHNRGEMWTPAQWRELGGILQRMGLQIVVVGADYDRSYYESRFKGAPWHDFIGRFVFGQTAAVLQQASLTVAYQSGVGIVSHYLGIPTAMWWRPKGNSAATWGHVSFEEAMAHCWTNPAYRERYLPLIYGRCSVMDIVQFFRGM